MVAPLRVGFFGTPSFALSTLQHIHASGHDVALVVTQPDRPRGRGQKLMPSPVKVFATAHGIALMQPERLKDEAFLSAFRSCELDIAVVAAYGKILPVDVLAGPRLGFVNVHGSLLPRWRGAAPVHRAILSGDTETGITIMRVVPALDAGPMLARERVAIGANETSAELEVRLADIGARLLVTTLDRIAEGPVPEEPQPEDGVTYAHRLERPESRIDWARPASVVHNGIRGLQPWPIAAVILHDRRLLLLGSEIVDDRPHDVPPGTVCDVAPDSFSVATSPGSVRLTRVQPEGRAPMLVRQFLAGHRLNVGDRLHPLPLTA